MMILFPVLAYNRDIYYLFKIRGAMIMKAAVFCGKSKIKVMEVEKPQPALDEVVIQVKACGVCGTDMHIYEGSEGAAKTVPPIILGHEFSGIISETGKDAKSVKVGDRVCVDPNDMCGKCYYCRIGRKHFCENMIGIGTTINGGFAQYCKVSEKQVYKISDGISFEEAAMGEPVSCCLHGIDLAGVKAGDTVMIIGGGAIGQIMLQLAKISGASTIILIEPVKWKRELGYKLGADIAIDPIGENVEDKLRELEIEHIDVAIECVGLKNTMEDAIKYVSRGGTVMMFGLTDPECTIPLKPFDIFKREITIKASYINPYTMKRALSLIESRKINVKDIITDKVDIDDINDVFERGMYKGRGKIIVKP